MFSLYCLFYWLLLLLNYAVTGDEYTDGESGSDSDDDDVIVDGQPKRRRRKKCKLYSLSTCSYMFFELEDVRRYNL